MSDTVNWNFIRKLQEKKVLLLIAHPDDEFVAFEPILTYAKNISVVLLTKPNEKRIADFKRSMELLHIGVDDYWCFNKPDTEGYDPLHDDHLVMQIYTVIRSLKPAIVITHSPLSGDYNNHPHHMGLGYAVFQAVEKLKNAEATALELYYVNTEGFVQDPIVLSSDQASYQRHLEIMADVYSGEFLYLERNIYPFKNTQLYSTISPNLLRSNLMDLKSDHEISSDQLAAMKDPWWTRGHYETHKRDVVMRELGLWLDTFEKDVTVIDVGVGHGYNWRRLYELAVEDPKYGYPEQLIFFDLAQDQYKSEWQEIPNFTSSFGDILNKKEIKAALKAAKYPILLSFQQAIYYFSHAEVNRIVNELDASALYIENTRGDELAPYINKRQNKRFKNTLSYHKLFLGLRNSNDEANTRHSEVPITFDAFYVEGWN